jgi:hypothetical protein
VPEEFEITISPDGEVVVHMKGVKGQRCVKYSEFFVGLIGNIKKQEFTSEHYEPEEEVEIYLHINK